MKKYLFIAVLMVANIATANKVAETRTNNMVFFVEGANVYHTTALSAHLHSGGNGKMMLQRESGCKQSGMHKCLLCRGAELVNNIK